MHLSSRHLHTRLTAFASKPAATGDCIHPVRPAPKSRSAASGLAWKDQNQRRSRDAERLVRHYHAERGNDGESTATARARARARATATARARARARATVDFDLDTGSVGAGLLANAFIQPPSTYQTHRVRQQAGSYRGLHSPSTASVRNGSSRKAIDPPTTCHSVDSVGPRTQRLQPASF